MTYAVNSDVHSVSAVQRARCASECPQGTRYRTTAWFSVLRPSSRPRRRSSNCRRRKAAATGRREAPVAAVFAPRLARGYAVPRRVDPADVQGPFSAAAGWTPAFPPRADPPVPPGGTGGGQSSSYPQSPAPAIPHLTPNGRRAGATLPSRSMLTRCGSRFPYLPVRRTPGVMRAVYRVACTPWFGHFSFLQ